MHTEEAIPSESIRHRTQSVQTYFPRAALIPPCAATVWLLVGNNFDMHAVLKPASARPKAARRPEPPAPTTRASYSWSYERVSERSTCESMAEVHTIIGYLLLIKGDASLARRGWLAMIRAENNCQCWRIAGKSRRSYHEVLKWRRVDCFLWLLKTGKVH